MVYRGQNEVLTWAVCKQNEKTAKKGLTLVGKLNNLVTRGILQFVHERGLIWKIMKIQFSKDGKT